MVDLQPFRFETEQRVRLKGEATGLYRPFGVTGNEGMVTKRKRDKYGYPYVYVQWDKRHWAYNGIKDQWVMESHVDPTEELPQMSENNDVLRNLLRQALQQNPELRDELLAEDSAPSETTEEREVAASTSAEVAGEGPPEPVEKGEFDPEEFARLKKTAGEILERSEAFIVVGISMREIEGRDMLVPEAALAASNPTALDTVQLQLPKLTSYVFESAILERIKRREDDSAEG